jgi:hypothetical protein
MMYKLPRGSSTGDVGFAGFRWQRLKDPCMGKILHIFRNLEKHVVSFRDEPFRLDHDMAAAMEDAFYNRWTMVKTDLHSAGALLNPYLLYDKELADDNNRLTACSIVYCDVTERNRVAMSRHRHNVPSRHYDGSRRCCYSGVN